MFSYPFLDDSNYLRHIIVETIAVAKAFIVEDKIILTDHIKVIVSIHNLY